MTADAVVSLRGVSCRLGGREVLHDVDLDVRPVLTKAQLDAVTSTSA